MDKPTDIALFEAVSDKINHDGSSLAQWAMRSAAGSTDIALAILGVAAGKIIDGIDPAERAKVLLEYLDSFKP